MNEDKDLIQQMLENGNARSEIVQELIERGFSEETALFMLALELGETDGDVVALDAQGKQITQPS